MQIDGQCHCGRVTYEAEIEPDEVGLCHCTDCQRLTGSAFRVTASTPASRFRLTGNSPKRYEKRADNGALRLQFFCGDCGSPIYTTGEGPDADMIGIRWGSINQRNDLKPASQFWCRSAVGWLGEISHLPGHDGD
ncbi:GFA family protein [Rhizobium sp. C4]|uniref:GFA family protein n=1 Tax=Rhizobium sp. C4 TaxID=1349800 RepID=UPI001E5CB017|nr:GFA family protein [Rhizobium sp. C4]MCD2175403.1 GFA family protein [Rhizobium sp. C4]